MIDAADDGESRLDRIDVAWLILPATERIQLYEMLETVEPWDIPVMLSCEGETESTGTTFEDGVVVGPPEADAAELALILRTLFSQGEMIRQLKRQLTIAQRHRGGLRGQIVKLDEELRLAAQIQREFLPKSLPQLDRASFHVFYRPASYVSGDIYDAQRLDENHVGFYIADAVGHGVPAALMTMFIKRALPTKVIADGTYRLVPPDEALQTLNREMIEHSNGSPRFATAIYGVFNFEERVLRIARAGHPPALLFRNDGTIEPLQPEGPLLGIFESEDFEMQEVRLEPGERVLIHSDGFELAFDENPDAKREPYMDALHAMRHDDPTEAIERLAASIDRQSGSLHQQDDLTALLLAVLEPVDTGDGGGQTSSLLAAS